MANMGCNCELCHKPASMFCPSDQASLCWDCDDKVHAPNFLVAKHTRTLLCHLCRSPTPWTAAGPKLGPTVSICHACSLRGHTHPDNGDASHSTEIDTDGGQVYTDDSEEEEEEQEQEDGDYDDEGEDEKDEDEDGDNQVVPWSAASFNSPVPPQAVSSSVSGENACVSVSSSKRSWDYRSESSEDEEGCSLSQDKDSRVGRPKRQLKNPTKVTATADMVCKDQ